MMFTNKLLLKSRDKVPGDLKKLRKKMATRNKARLISSEIKVKTTKLWILIEIKTVWWMTPRESCLGQLSKTFQWQSMMKKLDRLVKWRYSKLLKQSRWAITIHKNLRKVNPNSLKVNHRAEYTQHLRNQEAEQGNLNHRAMLIRCYLVVES